MDWRDEIARRVRGELRRDAPLAARTAIRVGGPADLLVRPADPDALAALLRACRELAVPLAVLGGGANTLVADRGVRGVVVRLPQDLAPES
jgi:UDP-N-acetylmuramate dehydrogenase